MKIMVVNGVNLNMLSIREKDVYGSRGLDEINQDLKAVADNNNIEIEFHQSNFEGEIVELLHKAYFEKFDGVILNAGAFTHYSYAILDAIKAINHSVEVVEVHISNTDAREEFRKTSVISSACKGKIQGFGEQSYHLALGYFLNSDV